MNTSADTQEQLVARIKNIVSTPRAEWQSIATETGTVSDVYTRYVMLLALIPAVAGFLRMSVMGVVGSRVPVLAGLSNAIVGYLLSLATVYVLAWVVNALAPKFGGQADMFSAFKLVAYGMTAAWLGGVFVLLPALGGLGVVAALYSIYLFYLGLPVLMHCPPGKALGYTVVAVICGFVLNAVIAALSTSVIRWPGLVLVG